MSYYLEILSETSYQKFLSQINYDSMPFEEIDELFVYSALKLKYEALTTVPTTVEKTMTPAQLYASNNPLWAHDYTANRIRRIMIQLQDKPKTEESLNSILEETTAWLEFVNKANSAK